MSGSVECVPKGRRIFIGDVHGMLDELLALIATLRPCAEDRLIFAGDIVDKGPQQAETVRYIRELAEGGPSDVVLVEGNHENRHKRFWRNLGVRPRIARAQAMATHELPALAEALNDADKDFIRQAVLFHREPDLGILCVHAGIPGDLYELPATPSARDNAAGKDRRALEQVMRTRFVEAKTGQYLVNGRERSGDPYWAATYNGRFGHVVFGHQPFIPNPAEFAHATGIDTGAVHGGRLTALVVEPDRRRHYVQVESRTVKPPRQPWRVDTP